MTGLARVRWQPGAGGGNLLGYVGTLPFWSFQIYQPGDPEHGQYKLMAQLPGVGTAAARSNDPDELKAEAEGWLVGFVASIGARFPGHVGCHAAAPAAAWPRTTIDPGDPSGLASIPLPDMPMEEHDDDQPQPC